MARARSACIRVDRLSHSLPMVTSHNPWIRTQNNTVPSFSTISFRKSRKSFQTAKKMGLERLKKPRNGRKIRTILRLWPILSFRISSILSKIARLNRRSKNTSCTKKTSKMKKLLDLSTLGLYLIKVWSKLSLTRMLRNRLWWKWLPASNKEIMPNSPQLSQC